MNGIFLAFYCVSLFLLVAVVIAFVVMIASLIAAIVRWKTQQRRKHVIRALVSLVVIPAFIGLQQGIQWYVFLPAVGRQQMAEINADRADRQAKSSVVHVGDAAPPFSLTTADGEELSLPGQGNVVLINFFATWCGPCHLELPHIEKIWAANRNNQNFQLLVIGREETLETVSAYRDKNGYSFPIAADPDRAIYSLFATELVPRTVIIAPDGRIVYSKSGFMVEDLDELNAVLKKELASLE